ncbi:type VI secretion system baseplate subunit TssG [Arhodomonas sp. SL1]|uniref:type VI secretion system baseplate subunit TssG n=1 Tax=Arhodomonas sp. SL1 TaxID=3425691 RepID=UPI003F880956
MAGQGGSAPDTVAGWLDDLAHRPERYSLYAALRVFEVGHPRAPRLGRSRRPTEDAVRVGQQPSLRFAPGDVVAFEPGQPSQLRCESFGLFGPNGPLPLHLTEYADERARQYQDPSFTAFINTFQHRLASLFYRAWADAQPTVQQDRPAEDRFSVYVGSLLGTGAPATRERDELGDFARYCRAGRFAPAAKSAEGLEDILNDYFGMACRIESFVPGWLDIPHDERLALGRGGANALGRRANLGARSWQCQFRFRIHVGPLSRETFERFLPGGPALGDLVDLVRAYLGDELQWDVALTLREAEVPPLRLSRGARLGWTSWLGQVAGDARGALVSGRKKAAATRDEWADRGPLRRNDRGRDQSHGAVRQAG